MNLGGGIIFEDPGNLLDLVPGVVATNFDVLGGPGVIVVSTEVPGLTDGIVDNFENNHIRFATWDPPLSPFLTHALTASIVGLYGGFGPGCIVLTGPDQHFHGVRGAADPPGNQYNLLVNEVEFVLGLVGICRGPSDKDDCKNDGWRNRSRADGTPFKNQGDCIQYVNAGK